MSIDDKFTAEHVEQSLEATAIVEKVNSAQIQDYHVFEAYVEEHTSSAKDYLENLLNQYDPDISSHTLDDGRAYYRIEITGLIDNLD